jgi:hypothetical protein
MGGDCGERPREVAGTRARARDPDGGADGVNEPLLVCGGERGARKGKSCMYFTGTLVLGSVGCRVVYKARVVVAA